MYDQVNCNVTVLMLVYNKPTTPLTDKHYTIFNGRYQIGFALNSSLIQSEKKVQNTFENSYNSPY